MMLVPLDCRGLSRGSGFPVIVLGLRAAGDLPGAQGPSRGSSAGPAPAQRRPDEQDPIHHVLTLIKVLMSTGGSGWPSPGGTEPRLWGALAGGRPEPADTSSPFGPLGMAPRPAAGSSRSSGALGGRASAGRWDEHRAVPPRGACPLSWPLLSCLHSNHPVLTP